MAGICGQTGFGFGQDLLVSIYPEMKFVLGLLKLIAFEQPNEGIISEDRDLEIQHPRIVHILCGHEIVCIRQLVGLVIGGIILSKQGCGGEQECCDCNAKWEKNFFHVLVCFKVQ
jgi:hypothetical protein